MRKALFIAVALATASVSTSASSEDSGLPKLGPGQTLAELIMVCQTIAIVENNRVKAYQTKKCVFMQPHYDQT